MIERYTRPEMAECWSSFAKFDTWVSVEKMVMAVQDDLGIIPKGTFQQAEALWKAQGARPYTIEAIDAVEETVKHDVIAFLTVFGEPLGELSRYVHFGMTSSDLIDTALAVQIQQAGTLLKSGLQTLRDTLYQRADEHRHTVMIGRSHGIHGEPITFGLKVLNWVDELDRQILRLDSALQEAAVGQLSGAMGTYAHLSPEVESEVCRRLDLTPCRTSTQVISRDIHANLFCVFAQLAGTIEKISVELRHLQRTEVLEVEEAFTQGQKGSSAMPHKRNPISGENLTGLARLVRSYTLPALENVPLWHERDISHSSVERVIFPDAFILLDYMIHRLNRVMTHLVVYPDNMARNAFLYGGVIFSQRVLLALIDSGMRREEAYALVQRHAHAAWNTPGGDFKGRLSADPQIIEKLSSEALAQCFDASAYLTHIDAVFARFQRQVSVCMAS